MSDYATKKELGDALTVIAEQMHLIDSTIARQAVEITALKGLLAIELNPKNPKQGLTQIEEFRVNIEKLDKSAEQRKKVSEVFELLKLIEKHGPPRES
jgi:hypothetical protein